MAQSAVRTRASETEIQPVSTASSPPGAVPHLSELDEGNLFGAGLVVTAADDARVAVVDASGYSRQCLDFMSAYGAVNFGHRHVALRVEPQVDIVGSLYPPEAGLLADWLCRTLQLPDHRVLFQVGGSFAASTAIAIAQLARPGKPACIAGAFHGLGVDTQTLAGVQAEFALQRSAWSDMGADAVLVIEPGTVPSSWDDISCLIFEPVQGANGYIPLDLEWLRFLTEAAQSAGVRVIADEIQSGYFRHGHLSVAVAHGMRPDVVLFSKSMTNGAYPLSAVVYAHDLVPESERSMRLSHTFQTGARGFASAWTLAKFIDASPVDSWCADTCDVLSRHIAALTQAGACDVHVTGPTLSFAMPTPAQARELVMAAFARGLLVFTGGPDGSRIRVAPPINIHHDDLDEGMTILIAVCAEVVG